LARYVGPPYPTVWGESVGSITGPDEQPLYRKRQVVDNSKVNDQDVADAVPAGKRAVSGVLMGLGGILALSVPFLPWSLGINSGGPLADNAFDLARLDVGLRILAYLILGVGSLGIVTGFLILVGSYRLGMPGAVIAAVLSLVLTMVVVASFALAQFLALPAVLQSAASYSSYSFPPALLALGASTALMFGGTALSFKKPRRGTKRDGW
jgi:hypothetical protein